MRDKYILPLQSGQQAVSVVRCPYSSSSIFSWVTIPISVPEAAVSCEESSTFSITFLPCVLPARFMLQKFLKWAVMNVSLDWMLINDHIHWTCYHVVQILPLIGSSCFTFRQLPIIENFKITRQKIYFKWCSEAGTSSADIEVLLILEKRRRSSRKWGNYIIKTLFVSVSINV